MSPPGQGRDGSAAREAPEQAVSSMRRCDTSTASSVADYTQGRGVPRSPRHPFARSDLTALARGPPRSHRAPHLDPHLLTTAMTAAAALTARAHGRTDLPALAPLVPALPCSASRCCATSCRTTPTCWSPSRTPMTSTCSTCSSRWSGARARRATRSPVAAAAADGPVAVRPRWASLDTSLAVRASRSADRRPLPRTPRRTPRPSGRAGAPRSCRGGPAPQGVDLPDHGLSW